MRFKKKKKLWLISLCQGLISDSRDHSLRSEYEAQAGSVKQNWLRIFDANSESHQVHSSWDLHEKSVLRFVFTIVQKLYM